MRRAGADYILGAPVVAGQVGGGVQTGAVRELDTTGFPNASNTGPTGALTPVSGTLTVSVNGTVVENEERTGHITVNADNVIIRNCKIISDDASAIASNGTNLLVEDVEIDMGGDPADHRTGITPGDFTARRCEIYGGENLIWAEFGVVLIEDCYIHTPVPYDPVEDPHTDSIQIPHNAPGDITIRHNTIYGGYIDADEFGNAAITCAENTQIIGPVLVDNNLMAGGGFALRAPQEVCDFTWIDNRFSTIFTATVGGFGIQNNGEANTNSGNVIHETGAPVP